MEHINSLLTSSTGNKCFRAANPLSAWYPLLFLLYPSVQQQERHSCLHMVSQSGNQTIRTEELPPVLTDRVVGKHRVPKPEGFKEPSGLNPSFKQPEPFPEKTKTSRWKRPALANKGLMKPGLTFLALIQSALFEMRNSSPTPAQPQLHKDPWWRSEHPQILVSSIIPSRLETVTNAGEPEYWHFLL